jgi:exopolyphosphatase/guanosine-5'-triphosphate,3'-diphosphate pyrophosphatase
MISLDIIHACAKAYDITYTSYAHEVHVSMLCGLLFDNLHSLFPTYTLRERDMLTCAGLLHDIATSKGTKGHHKEGYALIRMEGEKNQHFGFSYDSLEIVALIARYHRKAVPHMKHEAYAILSSEAQERIRRLSALLRIADGLDYLHDQEIAKLTCTIEDTWIKCQCMGDNAWSLRNNMTRAKEKAEPFSEEFQKEITFYSI